MDTDTPRVPRSLAELERAIATRRAREAAAVAHALTMAKTPPRSHKPRRPNMPARGVYKLVRSVRAKP